MALSDERVQEMKDIIEKDKGMEVSWSVAEDAAQNLAGFAELLFKLWLKDKEREKKLKEFPKGYTLEGVGYSCFICGNSTPENGNWYDKWGIKCLICQGAIDRGEVPAWAAKHKEGWYSKYDLESRFNAKHHVVKKWIKEGFLKPCTVTRNIKGTHIQIFLLRDNKDFLPPKKLTESQMVKEEKDGQTWYRSEPWYRFVDPHEHLKGYKILDRLEFTMVNTETK